jgi:hypothetical protein
MEDAKETKISFRGTKYSFICVNGEYMIRRIDDKVPSKQELVKVLTYILDEFNID